MSELNIGKDFSPDPIGRFYTDKTPSGEQFREEYLKPKLEALTEGEVLKIILDDGVEAYGSSFLTEAFAGLVKFGYYTSSQVLDKIEFCYADDDFAFFKDRAIKYIKEAQFNSKKYVSTKP